jgi:predicted DCC family thiol-disulfide oxidoreductase YuxK
MVFDGDCNFCTLWIRRWQQLAAGTVDFLPAQDPQIAAQFPEIPREQFDAFVQLIETDGSVYSGAEAVFRALAANPAYQWPLHLYQSLPAGARVAEWAYRLVAKHRMFFSRLTRALWGRHVKFPDYFLTRRLFLRALGVIYLVAFASLWTQVDGLIGHNGILPADRLMAAAGQQCDQQGIGLDRFRLLPTLCWINASDSSLHFQCGAGVVLSVLLIVGLAPVPCLALLWLFYLSLVTAGREFLGYQWDNLLLEAGFLAMFFAPLRLWPQKTAPREAAPSRLALWLLRLLLFKLMFSSGCVKLASGDPHWRELTALTYHYWTQPLPTWLAWYANQAPLWFQKLSCGVMFAVELGAPWLIFAPRRLRFLGGVAIAFLQILILLTGNYTFFNWLTLALCLLLLDDFVLQRFIPSSIRCRSTQPATRNTPSLPPDVQPPKLDLHWPLAIRLPLAGLVAAIYLFQFALLFGARPGWFLPVAVADAWLEPLRTFNGYGLFAVMTTERHEIIVEGSDDGVKWLPYEFKFKPGDVDRRPAFVAPHQPRLDWQMWFAALEDYQQNPWLVAFGGQLLRGSPPVLALLEKNPFPQHPPRYVRAEVYDYHFTTFAERRATGAWWKREIIGEYLPPLSLNQPE